MALFGSKKIYGLDIGSSTIKMAELEVSRGGTQLSAFGLLPTPQGTLAGGDINNPEVLGEAVKALHGQLKGKARDVSMGLWGTSVIVKKISMPRVDKKLLAQQVRWEAEQYIPFDPTQISLTYQVLPGATAPDTMDLLLVAAQNSMVTKYSQVASLAGLKLAVLDVSGFALANIFELNYGRLPGQTVALLNIGAAVSNFAVVNDGNVIFSRDIPFGGANYTLEIHKEMGVTIPEAEALKLSAVMGNEVPEQIHTILASVNEMMIDEVRNSFDFFAASNAAITITRCFYTGGCTGVPQLMPAMGRATGVQFEPINPFARVKAGKGLNPAYLQQIAPFASIVMGLAARRVGDQ